MDSDSLAVVLAKLADLQTRVERLEAVQAQQWAGVGSRRGGASSSAFGGCGSGGVGGLGRIVRVGDGGSGGGGGGSGV